MKFLKIYTILTFCFLGSTSIFAQGMLEQYFGGNKDSLVKTATQLIHTPEPAFTPINQTEEPDSATVADMGFEQVYTSENHYFTTRDNSSIFAYKYPSQAENTIVLIHGVASNAYLYNRTAGLLQGATQAEVFAIDLRGHGQSNGNIGDVDYINQYVDDLADIIEAIRREKPNGKIIIAGHSMGGGVTLRYAMEKQYEQPDAYLLFAPLIGQNSPAISQEPATEKVTEEAFLKIHIERIIGLKMFNEIGDHAYDSLPVLFFNLPETIPLRKYSYRANASMSPDDYVEGLKAVNKPMLVLIGSKDEAFSAEILQKAILENSMGEVSIIEGATHNGVRHNKQSFTFIKDWFSKI